MEPTNKQPRGILGIGLDNDDGHKRLTKAESFTIIGGSEETHEKMTETLIKSMEEISRSNRRIEDLERTELREIIERNTP